MPSVWVLTSVAAIVASFIIGFLIFYIISPLEKKEKKHLLEEILSLLINFIIYIWVGKVISNVSTFIQDPLAVLAYPSNSSAFYIALFFTVIHVGYKVKRSQMQIVPILYSFMTIFLAASFIYESIQMIVFDEQSSWIYLALLLVLMIVWISLDGRVSMRNVAFVLLITWTVGKMLLSFFLPFTTVFGYMVSSVFFIILLIFFISLYVITAPKSDQKVVAEE